MHNVWRALVVVLALAPGARAQTPALVRAVTFDEAIQRALARNPTVARAATAIARAEAILQQSRALARPTVLTRVNSVTLDRELGFEGGVIQPRHQLTLEATAAMPVLAPARWAAVNQARDQIDVAGLSTAETRQQIAIATAQAYLAVITAQRQVAVEERALENAETHFTYAETRFEGGAGSRLNMLRAAQEATAGETRLENSRLALRQSQEALGALLAEDGPIDAAEEPVFDVSAATDEAAWRSARPDLLTQNAVIRAAERVVRDSWKDVAPSATASFDPQYVTPAGLFQPSSTWRFTVALSYPLFQSGLQRAVTREREVALDATRLALSDLEIQARSEIRLAQTAIESRERTLEIARRGVEQADEVMRITTTAFEVGATTNIEVIDAQRSARDAETNVALAQDAVQRARLDLLVALGRFPQ